jgi:competence protein ComEC
MTNLFNPPKGTFRTVFLHVGQGDATLMLIPDGERHQFVLIDSNKCDESVDIANLLKDQIPNNELIFINTHPHKDHLKGINEIHKAVNIREIWHSGHVPHRDNREEYNKMKEVVSKIGEENEYYLRGSREANMVHADSKETSKVEKKIGDVDFRIFSPAKYVCEEIDDEDAKTRKKRIHEQCGVVKFTYECKSILITGDADKAAWAEHITPYYKDLLEANVLTASHHGSRSFFKDGEDDESPFTAHIEEIKPEYLVISAPKKSQFDHPHNDAMEIYREYVSEERIFNLGEKEQSLIVDIDSDGNLTTEWYNESGDKVQISRQNNTDSSFNSDVFYTSKARSKPYCVSC